MSKHHQTGNKKRSLESLDSGMDHVWSHGWETEESIWEESLHYLFMVLSQQNTPKFHQTFDGSKAVIVLRKVIPMINKDQSADTYRLHFIGF